MLKILWRNGACHEEIAGLQDDRFHFIVESDQEKALTHLDDIEVLADGNPSEVSLDAPKLRHVLIPWAGIPPRLREMMLKRPHLSLHNSHYNAPFVAQHTLALLLACTNRICEASYQLHQGIWLAWQEKSLYLNGKTALLLGYGAIARALEPSLKALGLHITCLRSQADDKSYGLADLAKALSQADVILCTLPETPSTLGIINAEMLAVMKPGAIFINVGRAKVTEPWALYEALRVGRLSAAGLDVWWHYPKAGQRDNLTYPADPPFHELANVIMSPHRASSVDAEEAVRFQDVLKTLISLGEGGNRNQVDLHKGY
ncbi:MAG: NAD(P)-dependent oxidoreductase [Deinococcales bacterium]